MSGTSNSRSELGWMGGPQRRLFAAPVEGPTPVPGTESVRQVWAACCPYPMPADLVIAYSAMLFRDWWRIETPCGHVELELDDAGGVLGDERELDETNNVLDTLTYGIENRDPKISRAIVEVYAQAHPEQFPPGLDLSSLSVRDIDALRSSMIRYLEHHVAAGTIRLYEDDVTMAQIDVLEPIKFAAQPLVPEKTIRLEVRMEDSKGRPINGTRLRLHLPDGDEQEKRTNASGEIRVEKIAVAGIVELEFLDFERGGGRGSSR